MAVAVLVLVAAGGAVLLTQRIGNGVPRVPDAFGAVDPAARPVANGATTFLLVGTDTRAAGSTTGSGAVAGLDTGSQRSDVIMVATVQPDGTTGSVVSIPRDSWVDIPGKGFNKINAAYAFGGASLLVSTVEKLTGTRIDHFGLIDFGGFRTLVDSVGGVDVQVATTTNHLGVEFREGVNHLDGTRALAYVHQRTGLPGGDIDRGKRQQNVLRALLTKVGGGASDPAVLYGLARSVGETVSVDDTLTNGGLASLAVQLRALRSSGVTFLTAPVSELGYEGAQSVVRLDRGRGAELWSAVRDGSVGAFVERYPDSILRQTPS